MRWGKHLLLAAIVGVLAVVTYETYTEPVSKLVEGPVSMLGTGLVLVILVAVIIIAWSRTSGG